MDHPRHHSERGFTIIEVLVAMFVLIVGLVGTFALVDTANSRGTASKGREAATTLTREITEQVRAMAFSELTPALVPVRLQEKPALADASTAPGWQVSRRGFEFTVATTVCSIDDPGDDYGSHPSSVTFCSEPGDTVTEGTDDGSPEDLKRITVTTSFADRGRTVRSRSVSTINATGQFSGLPVTALWLQATDPSTSITSPTEPVIGTAVNQLVFRVTTPGNAAKVVWTVEGQRGTPDATRINDTTWEFRWGVAAASDGTYAVSAQAVDAKGEVGAPREMPVRLARTTPPAPAALRGGYNQVRRAGVTYNAAELEWPASPGRNIEGYRLYRGDNTLACPASASVISTATSCVDETPPAATGTTDAARTYRVVALYRDAGNVLRETAARDKMVVPYTWTTTSTVDEIRTQNFRLSQSTANIATNCSGTTDRLDLRDGSDGAFGTMLGANQTRRFCSPAYPAEAVEIPAQTTTFYAGTSAGNDQCLLTITLSLQGSSGNADLASVSRNFNTEGAGEHPVGPFSVPATPLAAGDRLSLRAGYNQKGGCNQRTFKFGLENGYSYGRLALRYRYLKTVVNNHTSRPEAPTGLTATPQADGTTKLTWTKPPAAPPYAFYRIYADGLDWNAHRVTTAAVDTTSGATTDSEFVPGGAHTYRVTAVSADMTESAPSAPLSVP